MVSQTPLSPVTAKWSAKRHFHQWQTDARGQHLPSSSLRVSNCETPRRDTDRPSLTFSPRQFELVSVCLGKPVHTLTYLSDPTQPVACPYIHESWVAPCSGVELTSLLVVLAEWRRAQNRASSRRYYTRLKQDPQRYARRKEMMRKVTSSNSRNRTCSWSGDADQTGGNTVYYQWYLPMCYAAAATATMMTTPVCLTLDSQWNIKKKAVYSLIHT